MQKGCEIECAARKASSFCNCLPWNYPNNFTLFPMCDMFSGFCFDQIISNEYYYKNCQTECLVDCKETSLSVWQTTVPLNIQKICRESYFDSFFQQKFESIFAFETYQMLIQGQPHSDLSKGIYNRLPLIKGPLLDIDLAIYGLFLLYEVKFFKSWS